MMQSHLYFLYSDFEFERLKLCKEIEGFSAKFSISCLICFPVSHKE